MTKEKTIMAIGKDRPGLVRDFCEIVTNCGCNITESSGDTRGQVFVLLVGVQGLPTDLAKLSQHLQDLSCASGLTVVMEDHIPLETPDEYRYSRSLFSLSLHALDQIGLVHYVLTTLSAADLNVLTLKSRQVRYPNCSVMFRIDCMIDVDVTEEARLRAALDALVGIEVHLDRLETYFPSSTQPREG